MFTEKENKTNLLPQGFTVTFHAGALNTPDNTLISLKAALDAKADIAELDVSFLPDLTPVIIHSDNPTDDTLPHLSQALALTAEYTGTCLNIDIKSVKNLPEIDRLLERYHLTHRAFYTGITENWVDIVKNNSRVPYYLNAVIDPLKKDDDEYLSAFADKMKALGALGLNANYQTVSEKTVKVLQNKGFKVSLWTVNELSDMKKVLAWAPDNITTRHPDVLRTLL